MQFHFKELLVGFFVCLFVFSRKEHVGRWKGISHL